MAAGEEAAWREPGQLPDAAYLRSGTLRYAAEGREIVGRNRTCFNNRPLYCPPNTEGVVLAGDRPLVRLLAKPLRLRRRSRRRLSAASTGKWFHEYSEVESRYRCGRMTWRIADAALPGVSATLEAAPLKDAAGFALRFAATGQQAGDKLVWAFGGAKHDGEPAARIGTRSMRGNPNVCKTGDPRKPQLKLGMVPDWCRGNRVRIDGQMFRLWPTADAAQAATGKIGPPREDCTWPMPRPPPARPIGRIGRGQVADACAG